MFLAVIVKNIIDVIITINSKPISRQPNCDNSQHLCKHLGSFVYRTQSRMIRHPLIVHSPQMDRRYRLGMNHGCLNAARKNIFNHSKCFDSGFWSLNIPAKNPAQNMVGSMNSRRYALRQTAFCSTGNCTVRKLTGAELSLPEIVVPLPKEKHFTIELFEYAAN